MLQLVTANSYGEFAADLAEMHQLRYRVFKERLGWDVYVSGGMEFDEFDALRPAYVLQRSHDGDLRGCVRLLPSVGPTMLRDTFPALLDGGSAPSSPSIWESSRFAIDTRPDSQTTQAGIAKATFQLFAAMVEFGLSRQLTDIVTVTDARMERILRRAGWPLRRLGKPCSLGNTIALAGYLEVSEEVLKNLRRVGAFSGPVLWVPAMLANAA
jgi:acyl homoserine lactone synthase